MISNKGHADVAALARLVLTTRIVYTLSKHSTKRDKFVNIRQIRENQGLRVEELAVKAGVSAQTVYRIEQGKPVSRVYVARVCVALGVRIEDVESLNIRGSTTS